MSTENIVEAVKEETFPISTTGNQAPATQPQASAIQAIGSGSTGSGMAQITTQNPQTHGSGGGANGSAQKRATNSENGGPASKKANMNDGGGQSGPDVVQIKVLIPSAAVGALIGKGGEAMRNLKNESNCRVQMSKNQEVYPGTNERICLVKGRVVSAMMVMRMIVEKIQEKIEASHPSDPFDLKGTDRCHEMKFVVPNTSAGMVIGKAGASIKEIREQTTANIQVYPKQDSAEAKQSSERVITVGHDNNDVLLAATHRILEKVVADPHHASGTDGSSLLSKSHDSSGLGSGGSGGGGGGGHHGQYSGDHQSGGQYGGGNRQGNRIGTSGTQYGASTGAMGGGGSGFGGGATSGGAGGMGGGNAWAPQTPMGGVGATDGYGAGGMAAKQGQYGGQMGAVPGSSLKFNPLQGTGNNELLTFLDNLQATLRSSGFNEAAVSEIMTAMQVLAKYNIMGLGLGLGVAAMAQMRSAESQAIAAQQNALLAAAQQAAVQQQQQQQQQAVQQQVQQVQQQQQNAMAGLGAGRYGDIKPTIGSLLDGPGGDQPYWR